MNRFVISGTDTGVGKTLLSSLLMTSLPEFHYWKPIQSGTTEETDSECVLRLSQCGAKRIIPESYLLSEPLSPHLSARIDNVRIDQALLEMPNQSPLMIEGAGGLLVPLTDELLFIDVFRKWNVPVLLACRSGLGTINHTLLSIEAMRQRQLFILGLVVIGPNNRPNEEALEHYGGVPVVGRIPHLISINVDALREVYQSEFVRFAAAISLGTT